MGLEVERPIGVSKVKLLVEIPNSREVDRDTDDTDQDGFLWIFYPPLIRRISAIRVPITHSLLRMFVWPSTLKS